MVHQATRVVSTWIPWSEYNDIIFGCGKDVRFCPTGRKRLSGHKTVFCGPCFITVFRAPVAGNDHAAVRQRKSRGHGSLYRHYAGRGKAVGDRIVNLRTPTLAYAEIRLAAASKQYPPVRERCGKAVNVGVETADRVPGAAGVVFRRFQRLEPFGLAAQEHDFFAVKDGSMTTTGSRKVRQTLNRHLLPLRAVRSGNDMPSGLRRRACCNKRHTCSYEYGYHSHLHKDSE